MYVYIINLVFLIQKYHKMKNQNVLNKKITSEPSIMLTTFEINSE